MANQAITYLYNEEEWIRTVFADVAKGALRTGKLNCDVLYISLFLCFILCVDVLAIGNLSLHSDIFFIFRLAQTFTLKLIFIIVVDIIPFPFPLTCR